MWRTGGGLCGTDFTPEKIIVIGGGHVGKAVAHLAKWLGFRVAISDDRTEFCTPEMNPDADEFYPVPMADLPKHVNTTGRLISS